MKKLLALLLAMIMVLSFAACGGGDEEESPKKDRDEKETTEEVTEPEKELEGQELELDLFTLVYDEEVWTLDEDAKDTNETWSKVVLTIPDGDGFETRVDIWASGEDLEDFRGYLNDYGFEAEKYVEDEYSTVEIGGVDFLEYETEYWGDPIVYYVARAEGAYTTLHIEIQGDYSEAVDALLEGLEFTLKDIGSEDIWPWEGEPFKADDVTETVGDFTVDSVWVPFEEPFVTFETFDNTVAVVGDTAYVLSAGKLYAYDLSEALELSEEIEVSEEHDTMYADENGVLWVSGFMADFVGLVDGEEAYNFGSDLDSIAIAPNGQWGVSWFSGPECTLVTIGADEITTADIVFEEVETIMHLNVDNDYIYVCGSGSDNEHKVYIYDKNANLKMTLADENGEGLGSITFMVHVNGGFMGLDGNLRDVVFWDESGKFVGLIEDSDLFGTYYPWFCGACLLDDGSVLVIMTEDRADNSAMELVAFKVTVS